MNEWADGNRITLLQSGTEFFPALIGKIDAARSEIHVETYIFKADATGRAIAAALMRAAGRGVAVHVMVDGFGSQGLDPALVREMRGAGVRFLVYRRNISPWTLRRTRLRRLHRKIALIDAAAALVGGINLEDEPEIPRLDYVVLVEGPLVARIYPVVKRLWDRVNAAGIGSHYPRARALALLADRCGSQRAAFVVRDNILHRRDIEQHYLTAIAQARDEILIANAYFLPGRTFRRVLLNAAARGVHVTLLLQGKVEYVLQHYATRALYGPFLDAGIAIHEYRQGFLHSKVAVIDRRWATVGSSNFDPFSLLLAREANVIIDDAAFALELRASLLAAIAGAAQEVQRERWRDQPWTARCLTRGCYELVRFLAGVSAYGRAREFS
ncbi:MAG TPA: cardiolipin synthase ClsB [Burkholderiales bacterium]|nr:cardiolipin synthase ClsB [Burkholderiales bacterium]